MKLKLLLGLLFVVWRSVAAEKEYVNHWRATEDIANVEFCSHDSYNNGSCICNVDYNGKFCLNRKCRNFGYDGKNLPKGFEVDRCICPPGFLGRNCEPVSCVPGRDQVYNSLPSERSVSLLVTYNTKMEETWKTGDIGQLICNKTGYWRSFNYNFENAAYNAKNETPTDCHKRVTEYLIADDCKDDNGNPAPCQKLNIANLDSLVQNSPPNSIIFIVTNMGVVLNDEALKENIIATSIARRIQINVLVYNNTGFMSDDSGLSYLSSIASATFGTYVLPSVKPVNEQYDIVNNLLDNWDRGNLVSAVFTNETKNLLMDNSLDYYVAAQTYYGEDLTINANPLLVNKTDFWKLYKISAGSFGLPLSISGQLDNTPVLVYSSGGLKAYSAFTSDEVGNADVVDAAYSVGVAGAQYSLVVRLESGNAALDFSTEFKTTGTSSSIKLGSVFTNRSVCQFSFMIDANCISVGASIVTVVKTGSNPRSVSFPVYCASYNYASSIYNNLDSEVVGITHLEQKQSMRKDFSCGSEGVKPEKYGGRSFVIIAENSKDTNMSLSSADNVFRNKNSIFYQLSTLVNGNNAPYDNFLAALHYGDSLNISQSFDYPTFLTKVMSATASSPSHTSDSDDVVSVKKILTDTIQAADQYSDILFIVNYKLSVTDDDVASIQEQMELKRSRLYVLFVQTYTTYSNDIYNQVNKLAVSSGRVSIRLNDYNGLHTFFLQYFDVLIANDIVAKAYSENQRAGIALNNVYLQNESYYLLVTNQDHAGDGIVNATVTAVPATITVTPLPSIGELQLFKLTPANAGVYNIPILFSTSGLAQYSNAVLFVNTANRDYISLSFVDRDGKNRNDIQFNGGGFTPVIYSTSPFDSSSNISITFSDKANPAKPIYSGSIINNTDCNEFVSYKWTTQYSWACSVSGGLYHIKIDRSAAGGTISRTFPITCVGVDAGACLNGGTPADGVCVCPLGWSGTTCESPRCLNGGTLTSANTCDCTPSFNGTFCESSYANCGNTVSTPDYRADLASLVIVADVNALAFGGLTTDFGITGVPITVVLYGDGNAPRIVKSTTNSQHLLDVLKQTAQTTMPPSPSSAPVSSDMYSALNLALDNQLTNRAFYVVYTSNADVPVDGDFLIRLAVKRAEIRVLTLSGAESDNARTLALVGNGVPLTIENPTDFQKYFTSYIEPLFQSLQLQANTPQPVFNVFKTDQLTGNIDVVIPEDTRFDGAKRIIFLHVVRGYLTGNTPPPIGDTRIYFITYDPKDPKTLSLELPSSQLTGFYAVEIVGYLKTAYLFNNDNANGSNEKLNSGVVYNKTNTMHIYSSPNYDEAVSNPANFPYLSLRKILNNGTLSDPKTVLFTRKSDSRCFYKYFTALDVCSNNATIGYQVQLTTRASVTEIRQQQFTLTCFKTQYQNTETTCHGHGSPAETCECDSNWGGIDCTEPVCVNGVRDMSVCRCPVDYYGLRCDKTFGQAPTTVSTLPASTVTSPVTTVTSMSSSVPSSVSTLTPTTTQATTQTTTPSTLPTTTPKEIRVAAFIIDLIGSDDYAYNQTIQSLTQYFKAFGNEHWVMLIGNLNVNSNIEFEFAQYNDTSLLNRTDLFWTRRSWPSRTSNVSSALVKIRDAYNAKGTQFNGAVSYNIFYLSQIELTANDDPSNNKAGLELFTISAVAYSPFATSVDPAIVGSLKNFSSDVTTAREYYSGLKSMVDSTKENTNAVLPEKPGKFSCVYGMQSNIRLAIDYSNFTSPAVNTSLAIFLKNFRLGFNFLENDDNRCSNSSLPPFYKERTALTAFPYYDSVAKTSTFCPSQYTSMLSFQVTGSSSVPNYENPKLIPTLGKFINSANCLCNRFTDDKTIKFALWLPRAPIPSSDPFLASLKWNITNAYHFVVPFYDITAESKATDLYYQILKPQVKGGDFYLLPNAATVNDIQTEIIDVLYEKMCEAAGLDPTAVPPPPSLMESYIDNRQDNYDY